MSYPKIYEVLPKDIILQIQDYIEGEVIKETNRPI